MKDDIAVVGLGQISPLGDDLAQAWARLMRGDSAIAELAIPGTASIPAATVEFDPSPWLTKLQMVGTDRASQMAYAAARRAMQDAGIESWADPTRVGVYVGTGMAGAATMDNAYAALYEGRRIPPSTVPAGMVNAPAAVVALHAGCRGPVLTYAVACASSAVAIAEAAHALRRGDIDVALAGGVEALLVRGTVVAWQAMHTLAAVHQDPQRSCRPFAADRDGLVLGEGAAFLVLSRERDARAQGREVYARLSGSGITCDARHLTKPDIEGQVRAMNAALASAQLRPCDVTYCNPHGTATQVGDPVECESLRNVWGPDAPRLSVGATKAAHGHLLGAAGALEAIWTVLALHRREVPPTAGLTTVDPACAGVDHIGPSGRSAPELRHAISNSFAFGGTNVTLLFSRP
ncbi:MAG TPA: beta-ketoacyl-[acyl-carrier-protein] synthase family protein [Burkholderiaceae bacterium]|nr:beta-ketoacyl-[acyl-carrier-protein] synthase family protein [Burkholderiaceae bacterium]